MPCFLEAPPQTTLVRLPGAADWHLSDANGVVEANQVRLNDSVRLPFLDELIQRKVSGAEKGRLTEEDLNFHEGEYKLLREKLQEAYETSVLREAPEGSAALHDLLVKLRLGDRLRKGTLAGQRVELGREFGDHELVEAHPFLLGFPFQGRMQRPWEADDEPAALFGRGALH